MVADRPEGEADQDRHTRPVRHLPVGAEGAVCPDDDEIGNPGAIYAGVTVLAVPRSPRRWSGLKMSARGGNINSTMAVIP